MQLLLGPRDNTAAPNLITVSAVPAVQTTATGKQTAINFAITQAGASAHQRRQLAPAQAQSERRALDRQRPAADPVIDDGTVIQMAGLLRQIRPNDWLVFTAPGVTSQVVQVALHARRPRRRQHLRRPVDGERRCSPNADLFPSSTRDSPCKSALVRLASRRTPSSISVLFGWVEAAVLVDQPTRLGRRSANLQPIQPAQFPARRFSTRSCWPTPLATATGLRHRRGRRHPRVNWPPPRLCPSPRLRPHASPSTTTCSPSPRARPSPTRSRQRRRDAARPELQARQVSGHLSGVGLHLRQHHHPHSQWPTVDRGAELLQPARQRAGLRHSRGREPEYPSRLRRWRQRRAPAHRHQQRRRDLSLRRRCVLATRGQAHRDCAELSRPAVGGEPGGASLEAATPILPLCSSSMRRAPC